MHQANGMGLHPALTLPPARPAQGSMQTHEPHYLSGKKLPSPHVLGSLELWCLQAELRSHHQMGRELERHQQRLPATSSPGFCCLNSREQLPFTGDTTPSRLTGRPKQGTRLLVRRRRRRTVRRCVSRTHGPESRACITLFLITKAVMAGSGLF